MSTCCMPGRGGQPCGAPAEPGSPVPLCWSHVLDVALAVLVAGGPDALEAGDALEDEPKSR